MGSDFTKNPIPLNIVGFLSVLLPRSFRECYELTFLILQQEIFKDSSLAGHLRKVHFR